MPKWKRTKKAHKAPNYGLFRFPAGIFSGGAISSLSIILRLFSERFLLR
jgi:hypothetical protein